MKSPEILSVSLASRRYTSEGIGATYVLNLSVWEDKREMKCPVLSGESHFFTHNSELKTILPHTPYPMPNAQ
ncbi:MAG: hypothetical protein V7K20_25605 [Nostoc sp.]